MNRFEDSSTKARRIAEHLLALDDAPEARRPERPAPPVDYHRLQQRVRWLDGVLMVYRAAAQAVADQMVVDGDDGVPGCTRDESPEDGERTLEFVRKAHRLLLEHPVAGKLAYAALAREGRAYAQTPEGGALRDRLVRSRRLRRASLLWRSLTMGMLDEDDAGELPSAYLDNLLRAVDRADLERMLGRLHLERPRR